MVVASPPRKSRFRSQDASVDHVYLKSTWVVTSLRHPALRVLCCLAHTLVCLYVGVASPLLTSLKTPASFPVYGSIVRAFGTGFTWQKLIFQSVLSTSLLLLLRLVAYPRLVQRQWNWESSFHHATQTFSRLSRASASDGHGDAIQTATTDQRRVLALHTFTAGGASAAPAVRSQVWNVGASHGSWTFVAATFPFFWATAVYVIRKCVQGVDVEGMLFPEHYDDVWNSLQQLELQKHISTALVALSCIKLLVTLDWVLQDREFNRVFFGSWLLSVRRAYTDFPIVRIMGCWLSLAGVVVGGVCFGAISTLQADWARWNLDGANEHYTELWLSNMSWLALLGSLLVALDLLWVVQDFEFPSFASPLGSRMFGLPVEHFTLRFPLPFRMSFSSKWLGGFLVLALLVPLEISQVLQIVEYSPDKYEQYANSTTFQVIPLNSTHSHSLDETFNNIDEATRLMLEMGSLSRYFPWSAWDLSPALATLCLSVATLCWLWEKEACKMCFAVYLGLSDAQDERVKVFTKLNRKVPAATKHHLSSQQRLRILYKLRARSDSFCISLAALSVLTVWLQFRAIWRSSAKFHRDLPLQAPGETYAALLFLITLVLLHQVYYRYSLKMEIMVLRNQIPQECRHSIWQSPRLLLLPLLTEMILCGVFLPPLVHGRVHLDEERLALPRATLEVIPACPHPLTMKTSHQACELQYAYPLEIVNMIVLVRLYWFARVIRNQLLKRVVAMTVSSRMLSGRDIPVDSLWWSFRVSFALRPSKVLITLFVVLWVSTAAAVSIFERPFPSKLEGEDHALWLTLVTMTGVGYGDAYPITTGGRIAIVLGAVFGGLAFMSLMTSEFLDSLKGTKREHAVLSAMDTMKWERTVRVFAAQLIQAAWGYHRLHNGEPNQRSKLSRRVAKAAHQFKRCRKRKPLQASNASHAFQTDELSGFVSNQVESWLVSTQAESNALLESLEIQVDRIENSLQTWM